MNLLKQPTKAEVRAWLYRRQAAHQPLPDMAQIRRALGWSFIKPAGNLV
jgi:hypothetical protein